MADRKITERDINSLLTKTAFYLQRWKMDPVAFVVEAARADKYGWPTQQQAEILGSVATEDSVAIYSCRGAGKTRLMAWVIWWFMVCWKRDGHSLKILLTSPGRDQMGDVIWSEMAEVHRHLVPWLGDKFEINKDGMFCIEDRDSWFCTPRTAQINNEHAMAGIHGDTLTIVDESSSVTDATFFTLDAGRTDEIAKMVCIGNPTKRTGWFKDVCTGKRTGWKVHQISALDTLTTDQRPVIYFDPFGEMNIKMVNGQVSPISVEKYNVDDHLIYYPNVLGQFPETDASQLIRSEWVDAAWNREMEEQHFAALEPSSMGLDVADDGVSGDETSYTIRRGSVIEENAAWKGMTLTETAARVTARYNELKKAGRAPVHICVDAVGVGAGVFDMLRSAGLPVRRVMAQGRAFDTGGTKCNLMRDALWWGMRCWFQDTKVRFAVQDENMDKLKEQLKGPVYNTDNGKVRVEKKKDAKRRSLPSPDRAESLALTFYTKPKAQIVKKTHSPTPDYKRPALTFRRETGEPDSWRMV